jgi:Leucine-rich repeat (LRR) protein
MPKLRSLKMADCALTSVQLVKMIDTLSNYTHLQTLDLSFNQYVDKELETTVCSLDDDVAVALMIELPTMTKLEKLIVHVHNFSEVSQLYF